MSTFDKYIKIEEVGVSPTGKTKVWLVVNEKKNFAVGYIKWYGGFRKYCFFPVNGTLYDSDCMQKIAEFLQDVNKKTYARQKTTNTK